MEDDFRADLEALLERHASSLAMDENGLPLVADYVLAVSVDDGGDARGGNCYVTGRRGTPTYRSIGLLHHAMHVMTYHGMEDE